MRRVIVESPYAGDVDRNAAYLRRALRDCISRGESPYASHRMLTDALDDGDAEERRIGIAAGYAWMRVAEAVAFYVDYGWSNGMKAALYQAHDLGLVVEERSIGTNEVAV